MSYARRSSNVYAQVHHPHAKPMSDEHTIDELIDAFNAQAQAEGRYDSRTFWEAPARPGSIRDIPETERRKRISHGSARGGSRRKRLGHAPHWKRS